MKRRTAIIGITGIVLIASLAMFIIVKTRTASIADAELYRIDHPLSSDRGTYFLQTDGDQIFFIDEKKSGGIYSMSKRGNLIKRLTKHPAIQLLLEENTIYYTIEGENSGIYRMDKEGLNQEKIANSSFASIIGIENDQLYYVDSDENYALKKLDLQRLTIETLSSDWIGPAKIRGDQLYYVNHTDNWSLYRMPLDGGSPQKIIKQEVLDFFFSSQGIVTQNEQGQVYLHDESLNFANSPVLLVQQAAHVEIAEDRLVYSRDNGKIYTLNISDKPLKNPQILLQPEPPVFGNFFMVSDWLYYYDSMSAKTARLHRAALPASP